MTSLEASVRATLARCIGLLAAFNRRRLRAASPHPFLVGIHKPMEREETLTDLAVTGAIPPTLDGRYLRIGPNPIDADPRGHHWFVGDGMVHGVALKGGRALWYRNRWIRSRAVSRALGEVPAPGPRHWLGDTVNTNVVEIGGRTWALVEAGSHPVELSASLDRQVHNPFDGTLRGAFTGHPHRDPETGEHYAVTYDPGDPGTVRLVVLSPEGAVTRVTPVPVRHGPLIHDCALTGRFACVLDLPVTFSARALVGGHRLPYGWNPEHRARVGLLPRAGAGADVVWCDVDPCFVFHVVNAYDLPDGRVVLDVVAYDRMFAESRRGPDALGRFERWTIDPDARSVDRRVVDASPQEFPRIDDRRFGRPHRFAYTIALSRAYALEVPGVDGRAHVAAQLYKHDLRTGTRTAHAFGSGHEPGEFVFVPAAPNAGEDEGWLIGFVIDGTRDTTDLVILDARTMGADPVASVTVPHRVPPGFHGNWLPSP